MKPISAITPKVTRLAHLAWFIALFALVACFPGTPKKSSDQTPPLFPDYIGVTIPPNIAPLNFTVEGARKLRATILFKGMARLVVTGRNHVEFPLTDWHALMFDALGDTVQVQVDAWTDKDPEGTSYAPFDIYVAEDDIDPWLAYRLIPPGYENYKDLGIYQRDLSSFEVRNMLTTRHVDGSCVNCHHFAHYSPDTMMLHNRGANGGTLVKLGKTLKKVNIAAMGPGKSGSYPAFHPQGRYIAFSSNKTRQAFYGHCRDKIEVYDLTSDLIIYDYENDTVYADARFNDSISWESYPTFSPDGNTLYFCSGRSVSMPREYKQLHYSLLSVPFDTATCTLGQKIDTLYNAEKLGGSISYPRISPNGRFMLFTWAECGTFPLYHREADLKLLDFKTGKITDAVNANSDENESYHSWSSDGKWMVFSSRRIDGRYTRNFFCHFNDSIFSKPFLLPLRNPHENTELLYSFNIPEFIKTPVSLDESQLEKFFKSEAE